MLYRDSKSGLGLPCRSQYSSSHPSHVRRWQVRSDGRWSSRISASVRPNPPSGSDAETVSHVLVARLIYCAPPTSNIEKRFIKNEVEPNNEVQTQRGAFPDLEPWQTTFVWTASPFPTSQNYSVDFQLPLPYRVCAKAHVFARTL